MTQRERITHVAIKSNRGVIYLLPEPFRHCDVMSTMQRDKEPIVDSVQGFFTSTGRFVTRSEAYRIAHAAGQIIFRDDVTPTPGTLYSEDLW